ncbi:MAG: VCBS repeat-containing protein, partial [Candidatus Acidiferrales bacterium]
MKISTALNADLRVVALVLAGLVSAQMPGAHSPAARGVKPGVVQFEDIARQSGLTALNVYGGDQHKEFIIETTGNGAAIFDYDNDGWPDIFLPNGSTVAGFAAGTAPTGHLYHNNRDGTLTDVTAKAGVERAGWGQGACVGDYDNDG